jgi:phosphoribosyl-AMP cyclohydrolase
MQRQYFQNIEPLPNNTSLALHEVIRELAFNEDGLIPVITQDAMTKNVLMFAWMNKESILHTLETGRMTYWSRSRQQLWKKGESSGNTQELVSMAFDCDGDCILSKVNQSGPACHTGRPNCFYLAVDADENKVVVIGDMPD